MDDSPHPARAGVDNSAQPRLRSIAGREILFDKDGFLDDFWDWSEELADALARESGIPALGEEQWRVMRFLREFYAYNGRGPLNRQISKGTGMSLLDMESLFPDGIKYGARRLAGLPNPKHCG